MEMKLCACMHACVVKLALLSLLFLFVLAHEIHMVLSYSSQVDQTLWSASYGQSVKLHCPSSGSVDSSQEAKAHSMAPWRAKGWGNTLPHDQIREQSWDGGR